MRRALLGRHGLAGNSPRHQRLAGPVPRARICSETTLAMVRRDRHRSAPPRDRDYRRRADGRRRGGDFADFRLSRCRTACRARRFRHGLCVARAICAASRSTSSRSTRPSCATSASLTGSAAIIHSVVALGRSLGMTSPCRGRRDRWSTISSCSAAGCHHFQGYLLRQADEQAQPGSLYGQKVRSAAQLHPRAAPEVSVARNGHRQTGPSARAVASASIAARPFLGAEGSSGMPGPAWIVKHGPGKADAHRLHRQRGWPRPVALGDQANGGSVGRPVASRIARENGT